MDDFVTPVTYTTLDKFVDASIEVFFREPDEEYRWNTVRELINMMTTTSKCILLKQLMSDANTKDAVSRKKYNSLSQSICKTKGDLMQRMCAVGNHDVNTQLRKCTKEFDPL